MIYYFTMYVDFTWNVFMYHDYHMLGQQWRNKDVQSIYKLVSCNCLHTGTKIFPNLNALWKNYTNSMLTHNSLDQMSKDVTIGIVWLGNVYMARQGLFH